MTRTPKQIVSAGDDPCALAYDEARARDAIPGLALLDSEFWDQVVDDAF